MISTPPPRFGGSVVGWLVLAVALIVPWAWTTVLERKLRRNPPPER